jgi:pteridine reductase
VNSAANFNKGTLLDLTLAQWQESLTLNLTAPFLCSQRAARLMLESQAHAGDSAIINILDLSAFRPSKGYTGHTVSKAGLASLTAVSALGLAPNIRVNAVAIGMVLRDEGTSPEQWAEFGKRNPLGRTGDPQDVAQAVVFLAMQPYITGEILHVDGGDVWR